MVQLGPITESNVYEDIKEIMADRGINDAEEMVLMLSAVISALAQDIREAKAIEEHRKQNNWMSFEEITQGWKR